MKNRKPRRTTTIQHQLILLLFCSVFALNAFGEEPKNTLRPKSSYSGLGTTWAPCQQDRLWRLEDDMDSYTDKELTDLIKQAKNGDVEVMYLLSRTIKKNADGTVDLGFQGNWRDKALTAGHPMARWEAGRRAYFKDFAFSDKEIAEFIKRAEAGDKEIMYLLSRTARKNADGEVDVAFQKHWHDKAVAAGHLVASWGRISQAEFLQLSEIAAREHNGSDIAYKLALGYGLPGGSGPFLFESLPHTPAKGLYWMRLAAERGNTAATDYLCTAYYSGNPYFGISIDYAEARKWCVMAAQASCSLHAFRHLSLLYEKGLGGLPRDLIEARYWENLSNQRFGLAPKRVEK